MLSPEQLVVWKYEELVGIVEAGTPRAALAASAICRTLFLDPPSIVDLANRNLGEKILFRVPSYDIADDPIIFPGSVMLYETLDSSLRNDTVLVGKDAFLSKKIVMLDARPASVKELVRYLANNAGGVHFGPPKGDAAERLASIGGRIHFGDAKLPLHAMLEVAVIVKDALAPLYNRLKA